MKTEDGKVIVSDRAQLNLGLTAKPLETRVYWKTITLPGMIVDRPGTSDRDVVTPAAGVVTQIYHVPGDLVQPGERLFTIRLASDSLQQTQAELFKASENIKLAEAKRQRLVRGGEGIPQARVIEAESEIARLKVAVQGYRQELLNRGLPNAEIDGIARGKLLSELSIVAPRLDFAGDAPKSAEALGFELHELLVEMGQQVQAGATLCNLANHQLLAVEGKAFRDETALLQRSLEEGWPVEVDFREGATTAWPTFDPLLPISYIDNSIDPVNRTFSFLALLENQHKVVERDGRSRLLWRFRPGQKVLLQVRVEKMEDVFVVPADAVVADGLENYIFTQNVNTFEQVSVRVLHRDRETVVIANDGALETYERDGVQKTFAAVAQNAAAQLNRMTKTKSDGLPPGYHIHADGSLHKNEDEDR
ncbi:efflux RND transporter periplasmic adaptor subunit [Aeoliella mucimassa]|uniref:efflux RND transporter periplasmic adaptor subunit n=1 Tax=Aeoliella mucimassa TaxID=2527972 RepID=UPI0018D3F479|nr:efflux RND transporter periplasmic adaptor subunit [Aeoliella mucimassa]